MRGIVDQSAVQHRGHLVNAVGKQEAAIEDRDFCLCERHKRTVDVSNLVQARSPVGVRGTIYADCLTATNPCAVIPGHAKHELRCAIAHRRISRFRVRLFEAPRNDVARQCERIFDKNFCARSLRGLPKKSVLSASSTISPMSMKMTRWATLLAKPISWVTTIMVMPSRARSTMTSSTSEIISGSSAEVGSSNSIAIGSIASARAIATRCC